jgi:hypothetical protein
VKLHSLYEHSIIFENNYLYVKVIIIFSEMQGRFVHYFLREKRLGVNRKHKLILAISTVLVAILVIVVLINSTSASTSDSPLSQQVTQGSQSFTDDDSRFLESALSSSEKSEQAKALIPGLRDGEWSSAAVLPEGTKLTIQQDTFVVDEEGYAQVEATVSGSISATFIVGLVLVDGQWLIYTTEQKR